MRKNVFIGGLVVGLAIGFVAPAWADKDGKRLQALESRLTALEAKVGADPRNKRIDLAASDVLAADIGKVISLQAADEIQLKTGRASLVMKKDGRISLHGGAIEIKGHPMTVKDTGGTPLNGSKIGQN